MISDSLERVLRLFIEILFIRYCHPDDEVGVYPAQKVLLEAQTAWWRILVRVFLFALSKMLRLDRRKVPRKSLS